MSDLLTTAQRKTITGTFHRHFQTFARQVVIFKTPKKVITNPSVPQYGGYGNEQNQQNITYVPVSGVYSGILNYGRFSSENSTIFEFGKTFPRGEITLKVREDARNYIKNGKTENILVDGLYFNIGLDERVQSYLNDKYYYFTLNRVV